jgi:predicted permease
MVITSAAILTATLPVFACVGLGAWLRWKDKLVPAADTSILFIAIYIAYPAYILRKILGDAALRDPANIWLPVACGAGFMLLAMGMARVMAPWFGLRTKPERGTFAVACSIQNYGYIPIPILTALFPDQAWAGILFMYTLGLELVLWTVGVVALGGRGQARIRQLFNPVVLSILLGLALNFLQWDTAVPEWMGKWLEMIGVCSFPLGLIMFGTSLADLVRKPAWHHHWQTPLGAILLRLALLPATMLVLTHWIQPNQHLRHIIAVQAAMPAAMLPVIMAKRYGGDEPTATRVVLFTTIFSLLTIPLVVKAALGWLQ